jgi:hypothetical protein
MRISVLVASVLCGLALPFVAVNSALAHEHRKVGSFEMIVGWADEPTYTGFKNAVQVILMDAKDKPVTNLGDTLKVEVIFGDQKSSLLTFEPAFDLDEKWGRPGDYRAALIPTRPGTYTFHFVGSIRGQKIDQKFTSSEKTFDSPRTPSDVEFPAKDPSSADLASRLERLSAQADAAVAAAQAGSQARTVSYVAVVLGIVSLFGAFRGRK